ncbi:succinate dehydrogenase / fumarate reductase membrane anchor subunit [Luteibacter jiangsuensis]|uniref:Succinate dehydrogenase hydrophobic membrane anchor subunit n=1 Tax=Luteibacter jiangsuensis TaxID=637577 RepID=A0ABT9SSI1_9GAMM|nr:succinate dehydrogenase, hydrophobic membrane anchor protein [Luteibacter jiangsuensis]MDQ0007948.1 succinate dehydrogenase / fumarate reductase membrane anchor subunit [Luteibacter jiangsuensis]
MNKDLRNPLARARGLGSAKEGVSHWMLQRVTALGLIFLTLWFVVTVVSLAHADFDTARATLAKPWNAVLLIALIITMFRHAVLGLQVVIEDYVHTRWLEVASLVVIKFIAVLATLTGVLAVLRVALGS